MLNFFDEQSGGAERGDESTGIISVSKESAREGVSAAWYILDGRKLDGQPTAKGLYIHGGKKVIVK